MPKWAQDQIGSMLNIKQEALNEEINRVTDASIVAFYGTWRPEWKQLEFNFDGIESQFPPAE